jgi:hypothetical protein
VSFVAVYAWAGDKYGDAILGSNFANQPYNFDYEAYQAVNPGHSSAGPRVSAHVPIEFEDLTQVDSAATESMCEVGSTDLHWSTRCLQDAT